MCNTRTIWISLIVLLGVPLGAMLRAEDPNLIGLWKLDDGSGTVAKEATGKGVDGILSGNPAWDDLGVYGGCLLFDGTDDYIFIDGRWKLNAYTLSVWFRCDSPGQRDILSAYERGVQHGILIELQAAGTLRFLHRFPLGTGGGTNVYSTATYADGLWHHVAVTKSAAEIAMYVDGLHVGSAADTSVFNPTDYFSLAVGTLDNERELARMWLGAMDHIQVYDRPLTAADIQSVMKAETNLASEPSPADRATDVPRDVVLGWTAGESAATHDVYFGTVFDDVNEASSSDSRGVLVSQNQTDTTYDPDGLLAYGQTYYWRIDEVNAAPDHTVFKGETWSFIAEPFSYPVIPTAATASSAQPGMGPENTVNGSGLGANDEHSTELTQMWTSTGAQPNWIQYEFDRAYKLDQLWVWNSNQAIEPFLGFGAKAVTIEYSTDGATWTAVAGVPEFAQADGTATYQANTIVDFGGVTARFVKLTISANWGGIAPQTGLSEVRFFYVPVQAREPQPADDATGVSIDTTLEWRPGREADSHEVYLGADEAALTLADTVVKYRYAPTSLDFGTTYFWKVDELGGTGPYEGEVWSFTTQEFAAIDDFEGYNDDDNRIYETWVDGWINNTGSQVGYEVSPFAERRIVHGGKQSMPLAYHNEESPFYSEAQREFTQNQNWTANGADSLSLWVQGVATNSPSDLYVMIEDSSGKTATATNATAVTSADWMLWVIPQSDLVGANMARVKKMTLGVGNKTAPVKGGTGIVYIDDIGYGRPLP
jgi:hypothetical protein